MENPAAISLLNDFVFCPASIYFHTVDADLNNLSYRSKEQAEGSALHEKPDHAAYSDRKDVLQGRTVYCERYGLEGKIDIFDIRTGVLTERKRKITRIYDGQIFQLYAYYFALTEMGYDVRALQIYSMLDNKRFPVSLPSEDREMQDRFEKTVAALKSFSLASFHQNNPEKCAKCVYEPLCAYSLREEI